MEKLVIIGNVAFFVSIGLGGKVDVNLRKLFGKGGKGKV